MAFFNSPDWPDLGRMLGNPMGVKDFVFQIEIILFFYLNYFFLIDGFYFKKKYLQYVLVLVLCYLIVLPITGFLINSCFDHHYTNFSAHRRGPRFGNVFFGWRVYIFLLVLVFSLLIKIAQHLKKIKEEKTGAELSFLKAQINPHFLFNTLNSIYSLSLQNSKEAPNAIFRLSSMMRYVFKETEDEFVDLERDISYLRDYIELQKLRMDKQVTLQVVTEGDFSGYRIAPMLLIPFVENAFKYGVNPEIPSQIDIKITVVDHKLLLHVKNTKVNTVHNEFSKTNLGLRNTEKRLSLLYSHAHSLRIQDLREDFIVDLNLKLA